MDIDYNGIYSLLKPDCITCNVSARHNYNTRCVDCYFVFNTNYNKSKEKRPTTGKFFKQYGVPDDTGKPQFFYFLYHQELNFKFPPIPDVDMFGNLRNEKRWLWFIHHMNGNHYDDSVWNLMLVLNVEHNYFHKVFLNEYWNNIQKNALPLRKK